MIESANFMLDDSDVTALRNPISHLASIGYCETRVCERLWLSTLTELGWAQCRIAPLEGKDN